jgi:vancomycin resistance protein YoaR
MSRLPRWAWVAVGVPLGILVLLVSAWAIDAIVQSGQVQRNVTLSGRDVGGMDAAALTEVVDEVAAEYESTPLTIETENGTLETTLGAVGVDVDTAQTEDAALDAGGDSFVLLRPFTWLGTLGGEHEAPLTFQVDRSQVDAAVADLVAANAVEPVEPTMQVVGAGIEVVPGSDGQRLDTQQLIDELVDRARAGDFDEPIVLEPVTEPPTFTDDDAQRAVDEANRLTANPLTITVADQSVEVPRETLVTWFQLANDGEALSISMNPDTVQAYLDESFASLRVEPQDAGFTLGAGGVEITPDALGQACCNPESVELIDQALTNGETTVGLELTVLEPERSVARAQELGIVEPIASFTTNYAAGQSRVTNIHTIADIVRGAIIEPGETFSLNGYVGPRTREKGFVEAGVIYRGVYESDVGGGVSQFATTTFNAAFFGGLDFGEYQSHSIYIDRYPYGREATVSYPNPDLQIINNTPYGVMIWTDYTASSVTVTLWSTKTMNADQTGQTRSPQGRCTRVTTERTRTWLADGHSETDTVFAVYRPGEGVNC